MDHLDFDGERVTCHKCNAAATLPKDGTTWPKRRQVFLGFAYGKPEHMEVTDPRRRPDGSEGIPLPPKWDALADFLIAHKHEGQP